VFTTVSTYQRLPSKQDLFLKVLIRWFLLLVSTACEATSSTEIYVPIPTKISGTDAILEIHIIGIQNPSDTAVEYAYLTYNILDTTNTTIAQTDAIIYFTSYDPWVDSYTDPWYDWLYTDYPTFDPYQKEFGVLTFHVYTEYIFWGNEEVVLTLGSAFDTENSANEKLDCEVNFYDDWKFL